MKTLRVAAVVVFLALFLIPAVFLRPVSATSSDRPLWTAVQHIHTDEWMGSAVIIRMQPSLVTKETCNVTMATAKHVAAAEILEDDARGSDDKLGPDVRIRLVQAAGLRWGEVPAVGAFFHPTQDMAVVLFAAPQSCDKLPHATAVIDGATVMLPRMSILHVGFPGGWFTIANGIYIGAQKKDEELFGVVTSVGGPGSSGGAIFHRGKLVGILVRGEREPPFRNLYAPIIYLTDIWLV